MYVFKLLGNYLKSYVVLTAIFKLQYLTAGTQEMKYFCSFISGPSKNNLKKNNKIKYICY